MPQCVSEMVQVSNFYLQRGAAKILNKALLKFGRKTISVKVMIQFIHTFSEIYECGYWIVEENNINHYTIHRFVKKRSCTTNAQRWKEIFCFTINSLFISPLCCMLSLHHFKGDIFRTRTLGDRLKKKNTCVTYSVWFI